MSWTIDEKTSKITMTKGDTCSFKVSCYEQAENGELVEYSPKEEDKFIFAVKESREDITPLFVIDIPKDTMLVRFREKDTKCLEYGKYIWEVSLNKLYGTTDAFGDYVPSDEDYHCTFIENKVLMLTTEVY